MSAAINLVPIYQLESDDSLSEFFGLGTKTNEQHRPLLTPDEVRQLGADSVIIFSANVPPIHATRLDPLMFSNLEVKTPPLLPLLEGEPYVLPGPKQAELGPSEPFVPGVDEAETGRVQAEPEF